MVDPKVLPIAIPSIVLYMISLKLNSTNMVAKLISSMKTVPEIWVVGGGKKGNTEHQHIYQFSEEEHK